jgi:hypothetical protein
LDKTGRLGGQDEHCAKEGPVQVVQSGWQGVQAPLVADAEKELDGQTERHCPEEARRLPRQVRQKVGEPTQVPQVVSQAVTRFSLVTETGWRSGTHVCRSGCPAGRGKSRWDNWRRISLLRGQIQGGTQYIVPGRPWMQE